MKTFRPRILILTSHTGGGHINQAQSLKERLSANYDVEIVDPHPEIIHRHYRVLSRRFMKIWDIEYTFFDGEKRGLVLHKVITLLSQKRLIAAITQIEPQLIISLHSLLSFEVVRAIEHTAQKIPLVFYLTDLGRTHTTWFTEKDASAYLAPTREIFDQALEQGIDPQRLHITGRPIRQQFLQVDRTSRTRAETLTSLGLDPTVFTVFLQGGAEGAAGIQRTIESIFASEASVQVILVVGKNKSMASHFVGMEHVRILPFTETIAPFMAAADVIAGKAGASFLTEAFVLEKPFLVTAFIPGQEAPNLTFLERHNLGWVCLDADSQRQLVAHMTSNPALLTEKIADIRAYKAWNSSANSKLEPVIAGLLGEAILSREETRAFQ